jgi:hypothetical protein
MTLSPAGVDWVTDLSVPMGTAVAATVVRAKQAAHAATASKIFFVIAIAPHKASGWFPLGCKVTQALFGCQDWRSAVKPK